MAEPNGLEPSSAWLTTKCLTSRPRFRALAIANCRLPICWVFRHTLLSNLVLGFRLLVSACQSAIGNRKSKMFWVGRRELNPHGPQSQCGALPIELRPTHIAQTVSLRSQTNSLRYRIGRACG